MKTRALPVRAIKCAVRVTVVGAAIAAVACFRPATAHHAFVGIFDVSRPIEVTGVVTKVEWMNPHVWIYIDAEVDDGDVENWGFEMGSVNHLVRLGWSRDALKLGDTVTIAGVRARDDTPRAAARTVTLADGEQLFGGQNESR